MDFFTFLTALVYPSFALYVVAAYEKDRIPMLQHFVVVAFYIGITQLLDYIFPSFIIYKLIKWVGMMYLIHNEYKGSVLIFKNFISKIADMAPFLVEFANSSHDKSIIGSSQILISHGISIFIDNYRKALSLIEDNDPKTQGNGVTSN